MVSLTLLTETLWKTTLNICFLIAEVINSHNGGVKQTQTQYISANAFACLVQILAQNDFPVPFAGLKP